MTPPKIRWGILGTAKILQRLLPAFRLAPSVDLVAIASRSLDKAKRAAAAEGIPRTFGSYEELLKSDTIDAVYIPLPNHLHAEWASLAADNGKHILLEKPICPTAGDAAQLVARCREKNVRLMDGFFWPHHPRTARLREMLDAGVIGRVERVSAAFTFRLDAGPENIRMQPVMGGGSLLDVGCYAVYGIRWAFGAEPVRVFAHAKFAHGVDTEMTGQMYFADGRMASFDCGFTLPLRTWMEISGTEGSIRVPNMWVPPERASFELIREDRPVEEISISGYDQIVCMLDNFAAAIREGRDATPSPEEGVKTLRVMDALANSARDGQEIDV